MTKVQVLNKFLKKLGVDKEGETVVECLRLMGEYYEAEKGDGTISSELGNVLEVAGVGYEIIIKDSMPLTASGAKYANTDFPTALISSNVPNLHIKIFKGSDVEYDLDMADNASKPDEDYFSWKNGNVSFTWQITSDGHYSVECELTGDSGARSFEARIR